MFKSLTPILLAAAISYAHAATYYVSPTGSDGASGASSAPWRTIGKAAATLVAGDTAIIRDGTYEEPSINFYNSGTASDPIVIRAQNNRAAILNSTSGCDPAFSISASYIYLENLHLSVSPNNPTCGTYSSANAAIRAWDGNAGFRAKGLLVDYSSERGTGIKTNQDFAIVEDCEVHSEIESFNTNGVIFRNNVLFDGGPNGTYFVDKGGARNTQIYNNVIHMNRGNASGILLGGSSGCCWWDQNAHIESYNAVAYNNVIINETNSTNVGLMGMWGAKDGHFYNNIGINGQIFLYLGSAVGYEPQPKCINPVFKNNILIGNGGALTSGYNGWDGYWEGTLTVDYNNFYGYSSGVPAQAHSVTGNPLLVDNASDWHLQPGSPCIGSGTSVTMPAYGGGTLDVSTDKDGAVRMAPWDLGVYAKTTKTTIRLAESGRNIIPARGYAFKGTGMNFPIRDIFGRAIGRAAVTGMKDAQLNARSHRNVIYFIEDRPRLILK